MPFDLLPTEIKQKIFHINRQDALNKKYKTNYDNVIDEVQSLGRELYYFYHLHDYSCLYACTEDEDISFVILAFLNERQYKNGEILHL